MLCLNSYSNMLDDDQLEISPAALQRGLAFLEIAQFPYGLKPSNLVHQPANLTVLITGGIEMFGQLCVRLRCASSVCCWYLSC